MDRVKQLSNVSFGGAWSEQIAGNEAVSQAMAVLENALNETFDRDLRLDVNVLNALQIASKRHPKGVQLVQAWERGLSLSDGLQRHSELRRIYLLFKAALAMG